MKMNKTTIFLIAIVCGEFLRHYLFFGLVSLDSNAYQIGFPHARPRAKNSNLSLHADATSECETDSPMSILPGCSHSSLLIKAIQPATNNTRTTFVRQAFFVHVFLYRRVESASLLLGDLTAADYKAKFLAFAFSICGRATKLIKLIIWSYV
jgi:hypothetical protein